MVEEGRYAVDLGTINHVNSLRSKIANQIPDIVLRQTIEHYLEHTGVLLGRDDPPNWFQWLDGQTRSAFQTRCADPPNFDATDLVDDGNQAWNYFIQGERILRPLGGKLRVRGLSFFHERELLPPT
jgi:hypothetical protein